MTERVPPEDCDELPDDFSIGPAVDVVWYDESDEEWWGADEAEREFRLGSGSTEPLDADELGYEPCNAVLKWTYDRYDEKRYCTAMSGDNFNQDYSTCKHHKGQESEGFMKGQSKLFKTGAHAKSRENIFRYLEPHKQIICNDLYKSLIKESVYEFDTEIAVLEVDVSDEGFTGTYGSVELLHPIPHENEMRCKALWYAALDFVSMQEIREEQFRTAFEDDNVDSVGERWTVVASGENGAVRDKDEHHLNLPLSRLQKDYKEHLKFGGVGIDLDDGDSETSTREYILEVSPTPEDPEPTTRASLPGAPIEEMEIDDE